MTFISLLMLRLKKLWIIIFYPSLRNAVLQHRVMAGVEHMGVLRRPLSTVIDIGANRGQFALATRALSTAKVISFEPLPGPAQIFRSVFKGDNRVILHEAAVGPKSDQREMHVSARDDSSSLLPISGLQSKLFPGTEEVSTVEVQVAPLETFVKIYEISSPAMLKLDVQGFEYEALCGCESLLAKFDLVYCECSFVELYSGQKLVADVIDWLSCRGFRLKGMFNPAYDAQGQAVQADFLFIRAAACES